MPTISRRRALLYAALVLGALVLAGRLLLNERADPPSASTITALATPSETDAPPPVPSDVNARLVVHVAGEVRRPGLYTLPAGSRINDALARAGGPTRKAALELVNLARPLSDGEQVLIPSRTRPTDTAVAPAAGTAVRPEPVHLNSATLEQLDALPGIGPVTAQKIIDYREQHGPFASVDELDAVPGIGPARLAELRELVAP